ncbi:MAG: hypothetical protein MUO76_23925 [Anaerolineaceae bacterium]|nr:hypothetical protein [Anaerolineaceae bacterium]
MQEKIKNASDSNLIKKIFGIDPVDWARYPDGHLSFISPTGQKFSYTQDRLDQELQDLKDRQNSTKKSSSKKMDPKMDPKTDPENKAAGAAAK